MTPPPLQHILLVEDDLDIQAVACLALEAIGGFTVDVCSSGSAAVAKAPVVKPDLIVLDVMMPGMDGPTTLLALRALPQTATTPVIFMTAKAQTHEVAHYKALGALDVVVKPFDPMSLASTITKIWTTYHG